LASEGQHAGNTTSLPSAPMAQERVRIVGDFSWTRINGETS